MKVRFQHSIAAATGPGTAVPDEIHLDTLARSVRSASAQRLCQPRSGPNSLIASRRNCSEFTLALANEPQDVFAKSVDMRPWSITDAALGRGDVDHVAGPLRIRACRDGAALEYAAVAGLPESLLVRDDDDPVVCDSVV